MSHAAQANHVNMQHLEVPTPLCRQVLVHMRVFEYMYLLSGQPPAKLKPSEP